MVRYNTQQHTVITKLQPAPTQQITPNCTAKATLFFWNKAILFFLRKAISAAQRRPGAVRQNVLRGSETGLRPV